MTLPAREPDSVSTIDLLARARAGDASALDVLFARYGPELGRFAHGRLPRWARDLADTPDLVQETLLQTFKQIDRFEWRGEGALRAYMRQAVMNRVRDELRRKHRRPACEPLAEDAADAMPSPLDVVIGLDAIERFEAALARMSDGDRELIVARFELEQSYAEIAQATGRGTPNAARMAVVRALVRLTDEMGDGDPVP